MTELTLALHPTSSGTVQVPTQPDIQSQYSWQTLNELLQWRAAVSPLKYAFTYLEDEIGRAHV